MTVERQQAVLIRKTRTDLEDERDALLARVDGCNDSECPPPRRGPRPARRRAVAARWVRLKAEYTTARMRLGLPANHLTERRAA